MFKKHTVQMKVVKDPKPTQPQAPARAPYDYVYIAREVIAQSTKSAAILVGAYVGADTVRRCALHIVATKVQ